MSEDNSLGFFVKFVDQNVAEWLYSKNGVRLLANVFKGKADIEYLRVLDQDRRKLGNVPFKRSLPEERKFD